jgi:hypothetical protein
MFTDSGKIEVSLRILIDTYWPHEKLHFEETYDYSFGDSEGANMDEWIQWAQDNGATDHTFYHLMILKSSLGDDFEEEDAPDSFDVFDTRNDFM